MIKISEMLPSHFKELYPIACIAENIKNDVSEVDFIGLMLQREGWVVKDNDKVIGCITLSDYVPALDIIVHCFVDPGYHKKWLSKGILKTVFTKIFTTLELDRVSGYALAGDTIEGGKLLNGMGFKLEGIKRRSAIKNGKKYDVELYGMMKEDCRWI